ncbi:hypothetical protein [Azospirillum sp. B506]|uniref:hypothetical protein n=1 Tax=Azospirillum sp. B506 TaxID=137721 RepID=UPI000A01887A|nr:hypothetical protein [Azospirillum sp. B506]
MTEERDHLLCGWRVRSAFPLPELPVWRGPDDTPVDVTIRPGAVPPRLPDAIIPDGLVNIGADGAALVHIPGLVRILLRDGRDITVEILRDEGEATGWRAFLLGVGLALLCDQRGVFPLHAATLRVGNRTVALAGDSGEGKSTLAFALTRRGHRLLSDDLTVLRDDGPGGTTVLPAFPRLKLWRDTLDWANLPVEGIPHVRPDLEKYDLSLAAGFTADMVRLDAILVLSKGADGEPPALTPLRQAEAVVEIMRHTSRRRTRLLASHKPILFKRSAEIARSVPTFLLSYCRRFDALGATTALIEGTFGQTPSCRPGQSPS